GDDVAVVIHRYGKLEVSQRRRQGGGGRVAIPAEFPEVGGNLAVNDALRPLDCVSVVRHAADEGQPDDVHNRESPVLASVALVVTLEGNLSWGEPVAQFSIG